MNILVTDDDRDERPVLEVFEATIRGLGHQPTMISSLNEAEKLIYDPSKQFDIAYIDNHFGREGYAIERIRDYVKARPDIDFVLMTSKPVRPQHVDELMTCQVGFFHKSVWDPVVIKAEIVQRANNRIAKEEQRRRQLQKLCQLADKGNEGIFRLINVFRGKSAVPAEIVGVEKGAEEVIIPRFELLETVHWGQTTEIKTDYEIVIEEHVKTSTELELGVGMEESAEILGTTLGAKILGMVQKASNVSKQARLKSRFQKGLTLRITDEEYGKGIRKRCIYRGLLYTTYNVVLKTGCSQCGRDLNAVLKVYVPRDIVEASVCYGAEGDVVPNEDGRRSYRELH